MIVVSDRNAKGHLMWGYCTSCGAEVFPREAKVAALYAIKIGDWLAYLCADCIGEANATLAAVLGVREQQIAALTGAS